VLRYVYDTSGGMKFDMLTVFHLMYGSDYICAPPPQLLYLPGGYDIGTYHDLIDQNIIAEQELPGIKTFKAPVYISQTVMKEPGELSSELLEILKVMNCSEEFQTHDVYKEKEDKKDTQHIETEMYGDEEESAEQEEESICDIDEEEEEEDDDDDFYIKDDDEEDKEESGEEMDLEEKYTQSHMDDDDDDGEESEDDELSFGLYKPLKKQKISRERGPVSSIFTMLPKEAGSTPIDQKLHHLRI
jgi:hypothetical protein